MLSKQLALRLVLVELGLDLCDTNDTGDASAELGGEGGRGDQVFVGALRIGSDEADGLCCSGVDGVWEADLSRLQALGVDDVLFGGQGEPDRGLAGLLVIGIIFGG